METGATNRRFVLTGGPGAGKTTLLAALAEHGYRTTPDSARALIAERLKRGLSPRPKPVEFARAVLERDVEAYADTDRIVFFDRGIVDALGMLHQAGGLPQAQLAAFLARYPYNETAFLLPPWEEIYEQDAERDQNYPESVAVFESCSRWYSTCGYTMVEVPRAPVAERVRFVERLVAPAD